MPEESNNRKSFFKWMIVSTAGFLIVIFFLLTDDVPHWIRACVTLHRQNRQIEYYEEQISGLDKRLNTLSTDRDSLETYAREEFLFSEPGDDIYLTGD